MLLLLLRTALKVVVVVAVVGGGVDGVEIVGATWGSLWMAMGVVLFWPLSSSASTSARRDSCSLARARARVSLFRPGKSPRGRGSVVAFPGFRETWSIVFLLIMKQCVYIV